MLTPVGLEACLAGSSWSDDCADNFATYEALAGRAQLLSLFVGEATRLFATFLGTRVVRFPVVALIYAVTRSIQDPSSRGPSLEESLR